MSWISFYDALNDFYKAIAKERKEYEVEEEDREPDPKNDFPDLWEKRCPECGGVADERVKAGLKCGKCTYGS